jgi:hypothetical protein
MMMIMARFMTAAAMTVAALLAPVHHPAARQSFTLCKPFERRTITGSWGSYIIRDDVFATGPGLWRATVCLRHSSGVPSYHITSTDARPLPGSEPSAYPEELYGCVYGACSPGSFLPQRIRRIRFLRVSLFDHLTGTRKPGRWDASLDIWFSMRHRVTGQAQGGEMMLWLTNRGVRYFPEWSIRVNGVTWLAEEWETFHANGLHWPLVIFERKHPSGELRRVPLAPFLRFAVRHGWLHPSYWMESIASGFELWSGGYGLGTRFMRVMP